MSLWHNPKLRRWLTMPAAVIVLITAAAAIAIPQFGHDESPSATAELGANVTTVRNAIALYAAEHNGRFPGPDATNFTCALTTYTHLSGETGTADEARFAFRRYLEAIPRCPLGPYSGTAAADDVFISLQDPLCPDFNEPAGWVYNPLTGEFIANTAPFRRTFGQY